MMGAATIVWDGAPSRWEVRDQQLDQPLFAPPFFRPEPNPAERIFEDTRPELEGKASATLDAKVAAVKTSPRLGR